MTLNAASLSAARPMMRAPRAWLSAWAPPLVVLVALLGLWQAGAFHALFRLREFQLPYPVEIAQAIVDHWDLLWRDAVLSTGPEAAVGLILGGLLGFGCALLFASVPFLRRGALPIAASFNSIPIIAVSPIAVLWLGFGPPSKLAVVALMVFAPMVINAFKGLYAIDPHSLELMTSLAASPRDVFWKLRLPHSLPYVFTALKVGYQPGHDWCAGRRVLQRPAWTGHYALEQHPGGKNANGLGGDRRRRHRRAGAVRWGQVDRASRHPLARLDSRSGWGITKEIVVRFRLDLALRLGAALTLSALVFASTATAQTADKIRLQIKWVPQAQFAGYFVALDNGYYADENLDVTIVPGGPDIIPEQQVTNGQVDFGVDWVASFLAFRDKGLPITDIARSISRAD